MKKSNSFQDRLSFGNSIQERLISFLVKYWNLDFVAGDRNGKTENPERIESLYDCKYIAPKEYSGAMLAFTDTNTGETTSLVMPDELFVHRKSGKHYWIESESDKNLSEKLSKIQDYKRVSELTKTKLYIIFSVWSSCGSGIDLYSCKPDSFYYNIDSDTEDVRVYFDKSKMKKLNKYPI